MFSRNTRIITKYLNKIRKLSATNSFTNLRERSEVDVNYLCDQRHFEEIQRNIEIRKGIGNIKLINELKHQLDHLSIQDPKYQSIKSQFQDEIFKLPNKTHPAVADYKDDPKTVKEIGEKRIFEGKIWEFDEICKRLKLVRTDQLGVVSGSKSYFILGELAQLEQALVRYVVGKLISSDFQLISVPDILHRDIVESCGMNTRGTRNQVYTLDTNLHEADLCLSGTSEMALAAFLLNQEISEDQLPLKLAAVSRCYRAETSNLLEERGIYRVHEFTKVEMFLVTTPEKSDQVLEEIRTNQEEMFGSLGLHFKVLDMPPHELGAPAYRKYDIEAWLHGRGIYGEISSCSNCTDYQSRRLGIKYKTFGGQCEFAHTLNGTACAIPRLLIALIEQGQNSNGTVSIPDVLHKFMRNIKAIGKQKAIPELKLAKSNKKS